MEWFSRVLSGLTQLSAFVGKVRHGTVLRSKILPPARARQPDDNANFVSAGSFSLGDALERYGESCRPAVVCTENSDSNVLVMQAADNDGYDDASDLEDLESILDECLASNVPHKRLAWHYRSRLESLIAFSNERYYDGRLVTFPSPVTDDRAVRYAHVPGGTYERGSGRVNREEARAVVKDVVRREARRYRDWPYKWS